ncbi:hypothetical protein AXG93_4193s1430 [Marchantia polymorpha subsp. ruderalis]|uniref:Uncharacterized protein n=1 Tax=Marchantia polymorpha subsp. ruderalis TaxID=1480154 RepID=A0A176W5E0_MARPO|nr:hypothetical protein AXG93_4193s1430 [Marchantia polymorpha subsp. ruderalis]
MDDRGSRIILENHRVGRNVGHRRHGPNGRFLLRKSASGAFRKSFLVKGSSAKHLRRKQEQAPSAQAPAEELSLRTYKAWDICAFIKGKRSRRQSLAFGDATSGVDRAESSRTSDVRGRVQKRDVEGYAATDDSAEATADRTARADLTRSGGKSGSDRKQVLGRCARKEGHLLFECESVNVLKEEEASFGALFKHSKSSKNGYKTRDYKDRLRMNVAVALIQLLQPHWTTYITSWQVGFMELALSGVPIHWARILWKATRQHAFEEKGRSINHLFPFLINFYRSMGCLTASERVQFPLLSRSNPGRYVKDVEVDTDEDETPACTPPAQPRAEEEPLAARVPRKRKWEGETEELDSEQAQNHISLEELVRQTRLLEQC